jgi:omega-6 fatty acid desaturase / acyl-lipid omega-6 desaturase (Delta-12 desaturase)
MLLAKNATLVALTVSHISVNYLMLYLISTVDFNPSSIIFKAHQYGQIVMSDAGIFLWLAGLVFGVYQFGLATTFRVYLAPYLWCVSHVVVKTIFTNN